MTSYLQRFITILMVMCAAPAWAGHKSDRYSEPRYDFAKVVDVQPVFEWVQVPLEQQVCREQPIQQRVAEYRSPAPVIFGAVLGGVIGNQLSRGHGSSHHHRYSAGRAAATFAGAAIGGVIAHEVQSARHPARYYTEYAQVCSTQTRWRNEERVVAWDVRWRYRGRIYHSRMDKPPGDRIRVRVNVDPVYPGR